ncbi:MAG TPA: TolC family protein [Gammaproteobacteria bacterium]
MFSSLGGTPSRFALRACLLACVLAGAARAQDSSAGLTLQDAVARALARNPGVDAAASAVAAERARRDAAALPPPLVLEGELEDFAGSGVAGGLDGAETTLGVGTVLELGGKRALRAAAGDARVALARTEADLVRLDLAAETARRFVSAGAEQERLALAEEAAAVARRTLDLVRARVEVGRASDAERATAAIEVTRAELEIAERRRRAEALRVALATLWGEERADFERVDVRFDEVGEAPPFESLEARLDANPDLVRLANETRIREAERRLADAQRRRDLALSAGVRHLGLADEAALVLGVSVPLGSAARAEPERAAARAELERLPLETERRRLDLLATLYGLHQRLLAARETFLGLTADVLPEAERAVALYARGFEVGSHTLLELAEAQERLLAVRAERLEAALAYREAAIEIEHLLGGWPPGVVP